MTSLSAAWFRIVTIALVGVSSVRCMGQVTPTSTTPATQSPSLPITTQIKKTIAFLDASCVHDFTSEVGTLNKAALLQMPSRQRIVTIQQLVNLTSRLQNVRPSMSKLSAVERARLISNHFDASTDDAIAVEGEWRASILLKMTALTLEDINSLNEQEISFLPLDEHMGTGFFVRLRDERTQSLPGGGRDSGFLYLVTNKHVAQPGSEHGSPCNVVTATIMLNHKPDANHTTTYAETSRFDKALKWIFPDDESVDLAVTPIGVPESLYDFMTVGDEQFIGDNDVSERRVVEGDPVLFSGLFVQAFNEVHTLEPIIRFGTLAMIPNGLVKTTMADRPGHLYFAEAHAFGGNSGSPMFVDPSKFQNIIGMPNYRLLGVISGEVLESADFKLNVTTTLNGSVGANSDVSTVVPVSDLVKLLKGPKLEAIRVAEMARLKKATPPV